MEDFRIQPLPSLFPVLPVIPPGSVLSGSLRQAHETISNAYTSALTVLRQEDSDPLRLRFHIARILDETFPILVAMEVQAEDTISVNWFNTAAHTLANIVTRLDCTLDQVTRQ